MIFNVVGGSSGVKMELLWENASPSSDFANQTIQLDLSKYDRVRVELANGPSVDIKIGETKAASYINVYGTGSAQFNIHFRRMITSTTGVAFANCRMLDNNWKSVDSAAVLIPLRIYGIKGVY